MPMEQAIRGPSCLSSPFPVLRVLKPVLAAVPDRDYLAAGKQGFLVPVLTMCILLGDG